MKKIDIRFSKNTMTLLKSLIGKKMDYFACFRLGYTSSVYGMVLFKINGDFYWLTNRLETMDYMNKVDDVGVFKFEKTDINTVEKFLEGNPLTETPIDQTISEIRIMNENQQLFHNNIQTYDVNTVRGLVFVLQDGREISLEKEIWFSEMINVRTGHKLMDEYDTMDDFMKNWEEFPDYDTKGSREITTLK